MQICRCLIELFIGIVAVEAVTEIIFSSQFFFGFRGWIYKKGSDKFLKDGKYVEVDDLTENDEYITESPTPFWFWMAELFSCGYCLSVWIAFIFVVFYFAIYPVAIFIALIFCVHRLSNLFHEGISRWEKRLSFLSPSAIETEEGDDDARSDDNAEE